MLVQSHCGEIELLPALPSSWKKGKINGICARGGYELNIEWDNGKLTRCQIHSLTGSIPTIRSENKCIDPKKDPRFCFTPQ